MKATDILEGMQACPDALKWAKGREVQEAWDLCERGDWMLWYLQGAGIDIRELTLAKARCAQLVYHLMKDERSRKAVDVAEQFGLGEATRKELDAAAYAAAAAAYDAADAAYDAAYAAADDAAHAADAAADAAHAAADAARLNTLKKCADIVREIVPIPVIPKNT